MDNAYCLSEPHWILLSKPAALTFDKISTLNYNDINDILPAIKKHLKNNKQFNYGGVKETYRPLSKEMRPYLDLTIQNSDIIVFILRNPLALYNSFKKISVNPMPISRLEHDYNMLVKEINNCKNQHFTLILEKLCAAGNDGAIQYINQQSNNILKIVGDFKLNPTDYKYGNHIANKSKQINKANTSINLLTNEEKQYIQNNLMPLYNKFI